MRDAVGEAVQGLLHARAENALRQRNTDPDIRVDVQGNESVEGYGGGVGWGGHLRSLLHTYFYFYMDKIHLRLLESSPSTSTEG